MLANESKVVQRRYRPARELAARATSKHGNPADHAIICSADVPSAAELVATRMYSEAYRLDDRSHRSDSVRVGRAAGPRVAVVIDVGPAGESILERGGFALAFEPRSPGDDCPRFEGQVRVDSVDPAHSRVIAQGRYTGTRPPTSADNTVTRLKAEEALCEIVSLITCNLTTSASKLVDTSSV